MQQLFFHKKWELLNKRERNRKDVIFITTAKSKIEPAKKGGEKKMQNSNCQLGNQYNATILCLKMNQGVGDSQINNSRDLASILAKNSVILLVNQNIL